MVQYEVEDITQIRVLERGDQIAVLCEMNTIEYLHFGIYLGAKVGVAEFGRDYLRIADVLEFKGDSMFSRAVYPQDQCLASEEVAKRAEDLVKNPKNWDTYSLLTNNCKHVATHCKTGKAFSLQVAIDRVIGKVVFGMLWCSGSYSKDSGSFSKGSSSSLKESGSFSSSSSSSRSGPSSEPS